MSRLGTLLRLALPIAALGCGAHADPESRPSRDNSVLTQEEMRSVSAPSLFEVIRLRRPRWLTRSRPTAIRADAAQAEVVIYLDNVRFGGPETLRQIAPSSVGLVQYLSPSQAEARFGQGHINGAILVLSVP